MQKILSAQVKLIVPEYFFIAACIELSPIPCDRVSFFVVINVLFKIGISEETGFSILMCR